MRRTLARTLLWRRSKAETKSMDKRWSLVAVMGLFACSRAPVAPPLAAVGRAELRQAAALPATRFAGDLAGAACQIVEAQRSALGLGAGDSFRVIKVEGPSHVRLQQLHEGIKVWGAEVVIHGDDGRLDSIA